MPKRIQRKRTKGWPMPPNTVSVTRPGRYGNFPAKICCESDPAKAVTLYRQWIAEVATPTWKAVMRTELAGKNLACFCPLDQPCHADVLLEFANQ